MIGFVPSQVGLCSTCGRRKSKKNQNEEKIQDDPQKDNLTKIGGNRLAAAASRKTFKK